MDGQIEIYLKCKNRFFKKKIGFLFGMNCWMLLCNELKCTIGEVGELISGRIYLIYWAGYINYCLTHKQFIRINKNDFEYIFKKNSQESMQLIFNKWTESQIGGESITSLMAKSMTDEKKK